MNVERVEEVSVNGEVRTVYDALQSGLPNRIREVVLDGQVPLFDKRRAITGLIEEVLVRSGEFLRTPDGRGFYFQHEERRLYDVEQAEFQKLLTEVSGLSSTENFFKFALDITQTRTLRAGRSVEVNVFSFFDPTSGLLAVSDGGAGMWLRERGGRWQAMRNGDQGIFFLTDADATSWEPEFGEAAESSERWWLNQFLLVEDGLSIEDSRTLLSLYMRQLFFPRLCRTRIIPCFLGGQGAGKTSGQRFIGRVLIGPRFDVTGVSRDGEDDFVAAVCNRVVLGLDNVDSKIPWLADTLALYATGQRFRKRRLYTTNEEASYSPRAILLIASRDPRFNRSDVTERLLPLNFSRPENYQAEDALYSELENRRGQIMGSLLDSVAKIADTLASVPTRPLPFRMADFASFGYRVFLPRGRGQEFVELLRRLEKRQSEFAAEGDGLVAALAMLLSAGTGGSLEMDVGELYRKCSELAKQEGLLFPSSVQSFGQRLSSMRRVIELELGVRFTDSRGHQRRRTIRLEAKR